MMPTRVAVVGAGWWATSVHLPSLVRNPEANVVAVCDPDPARADAVARRFGIPDRYNDVGELLAAGGIDAAIIATPHTTHASIVAACLDARVSVLVEKPMTTTARDAWHLVRLAASTRTVLAVGSTYQYAPTSQRVFDAVHNGIGELVNVNAEFSSGTLSLFSTTDPAQANLDDPSVPHGTTYSDPATGGGQCYTQMTHLIGALLWASGEQAAEVSAYMDTRGLGVDVVDALAFRLNGGALCVASSTGTTPPGAPPRHRIRFHGTTGLVEWDMLKADAWIFGEGATIEHAENPAHLPSYPREEVSAAFLRVLAHDGPNLSPGDSAAASASLIEAAHTAAQTKRSTVVPQGTLQPD